MKTNENGRSMIEMLGVLAIIGVLSVGGIYGYTIAMRKYRANEIVQTASMLATLARSGNAGEGKCMVLSSSGLETSPAGVPVYMKATEADPSVVTITVASTYGSDAEITALCNAVTSIAPKSGNATGAGYYVSSCAKGSDQSCSST